MPRQPRPTWLARWWVLPYVVLMAFSTRLAPVSQRYGDIGPWLFAAATVTLAVLLIFPRVEWARTLGVVGGGVACLSRAMSALFLDESPTPVVFFLWTVVALGLASGAALSWQVITFMEAEKQAGDG